MSTGKHDTTSNCNGGDEKTAEGMWDRLLGGSGDMSRRSFLKLSGGAAAAGALLSLGGSSQASDVEPEKEVGQTTVSVLQAAVLAVSDSGARVVTCVPGTHTAGIFNGFNEVEKRSLPFSYNEEVAYTIAHGASLTGVRSATVMKSHGLVKAGNSLSDSLYTGTTAGFVILATMDRSGESSDSILDLEQYLRGANVPYRKPRSLDIYPGVIEAFEQSERMRLPVVVCVLDDELEETARLARRQRYGIGAVEYRRDVAMHVCCPMFAKYQKTVLDRKLAGLEWRKAARPAAPTIPESLPPRWRPLAKEYTPLFEAFREMRTGKEMVLGDTSVSTLFAFKPFDCIDVSTYYGGSIPLAMGANLAGRAETWAVTGDYSFVAAGHMGLMEAAARGIPVKVLILHNGKAQTTGGQPIGKGVFERSLAGYEPFIKVIKDPQDKGQVKSALRAAGAGPGLQVVVAEYV